jgi:ATP-dependent Clp protease protease subunit
LSLDEIEKLMERDYFMGAKEALELGVVDEILDRTLRSRISSTTPSSSASLAPMK